MNTNLTVKEFSRLRHLHGLKGLRISGPYITNELFSICNPSWGLQWVDTPCPHMTDEGFRDLKHYQQTLLTLCVNKSQITDEVVAELATFPLLRQVLAANTELTDQSIDYYNDFPSLISLDISDTNITQSGLTQFSQLKRLTKLQLRNLPLTVNGLTRLSGLPLLELDLTGTQVSNSAVQTYRDDHQNCVIRK
ncbi:MAG: hypothetical protein P8J37_07125 [Fuerstiella sp.]|nr:hypothetical protein [Fuerstiella sp.]